MLRSEFSKTVFKSSAHLAQSAHAFGISTKNSPPKNKLPAPLVICRAGSYNRGARLRIPCPRAQPLIPKRAK